MDKEVVVKFILLIYCFDKKYSPAHPPRPFVRQPISFHTDKVLLACQTGTVVSYKSKHVVRESNPIFNMWLVNFCEMITAAFICLFSSPYHNRHTHAERAIEDER